MHLLPRLTVAIFICIFCIFQIVHPIPAWGSDNISKTAPQMLGTPEEDLSTLGTNGKTSKTGLWLGAILAVGLIAALAAGGGGGGGDSSATPAGDETGSVTVGW